VMVLTRKTRQQARAIVQPARSSRARRRVVPATWAQGPAAGGVERANGAMTLQY